MFVDEPLRMACRHLLSVFDGPSSKITVEMKHLPEPTAYSMRRAALSAKPITEAVHLWAQRRQAKPRQRRWATKQIFQNHDHPPFGLKQATNGYVMD